MIYNHFWRQNGDQIVSTTSPLRIDILTRVPIEMRGGINLWCPIQDAQLQVVVVCYQKEHGSQSNFWYLVRVPRVPLVRRKPSEKWFDALVILHLLEALPYPIRAAGALVNFHRSRSR